MTRYEGNDFYCDLALSGKVALDVVYEDKHVLAFHHTNPHWPVHLVVIPKRHIPSFTDLGGYEPEQLVHLMMIVQQLAKQVEVEYGAARVLTNLGEYQDSKHLHFHINFGAPKAV
jgi:histidine triad (HIT) family protein